MVLVVLSGFSVGSGVAFGLRTFSPTLDNSLIVNYHLISRFRFKLRCRHCFRFRGTVTQRRFNQRNVTQLYWLLLQDFRCLNSESGILILCHSTVCIGSKFITVLCAFRKSVCAARFLLTG